MALLADTTILGLVDQNPTNPGTDGRPAFESIQAFDHGHPGILHDILRDFPVSHITHGHSDKRTVMLDDQLIKGLLVTVSEPHDQCILGPGGAERLDRRQLWVHRCVVTTGRCLSHDICLHDADI